MQSVLLHWLSVMRDNLYMGIIWTYIIIWVYGFDIQIWLSLELGHYLCHLAYLLILSTYEDGLDSTLKMFFFCINVLV